MLTIKEVGQWKKVEANFISCTRRRGQNPQGHMYQGENLHTDWHTCCLLKHIDSFRLLLSPCTKNESICIKMASSGINHIETVFG